MFHGKLDHISKFCHNNYGNRVRGREAGQHSKEGDISTQYANLSNAAQPQPLDRFQQTYKKLQVSVFCVHLIAQI